MHSSIATISNSSEGQSVVHDVHDTVIDNISSRTGELFDFSAVFLIRAEVVQRQGFWPSLDEVDNLVQIGISKDRQNRSENFFLH